MNQTEYVDGEIITSVDDRPPTLRPITRSLVREDKPPTRPAPHTAVKTSPPIKAKLRPITLEELHMRNSAPLEWLVQDLMLSEGTSLIAAKPKCGKSVLARQLAVCVARGEDFLGRTVRKGSVLYLCLEDGQRVAREHLNDMGAISESILTIDIPVSMEETCKLLEEFRPNLLIVDPMFKWLTQIKDENSYAQVNDAMTGVQQMCRKYHCHVTMVHHAGKAIREDSHDSILGSTAVFGGVETSIVLTRNKDATRNISTRLRIGRNIEESTVEFDPIQRVMTLGQTLDKEEFSLENRITDLLQQTPNMDREAIRAALKVNNAKLGTTLNRMSAAGGQLAKTGKLYAPADDIISSLFPVSVN